MFAQSYANDENRSEIWFRCSDVRRIYVTKRGGSLDEDNYMRRPETYQAYAAFYDNTALPLEAKRGTRGEAELDCANWAELLA